MFRTRRRVSACLLTVALTGTIAAPSFADVADIPTPNVTGPVAVTPTSSPFLAADPAQLQRNGYVEREYYVDGNAYTYSGTTGLATATRNTTGGPNANGTFPYRTRMVVRRPADPSKFNGTVVMEWYNVTAGFDVEWNYFNDPEWLLSQGYAFVGVSAQRVGVNALKLYNPGRYGNLDVTSSTMPPTSDLLSYDVFGAAAKAVRGYGNGKDPMAGLDVERIIASGESQSGGRLNTYYNTIQPLHEVIDSFLITVAGGTLRTDRPQTKAIRVLSERENIAGPANDPDTDGYRRWEVAGSSHVPFQAYVNFGPVYARDTAGTGATADCTRRPLSRVQWGYVYNRAIEALGQWQRNGTAPPIAPRHTYTAPNSLTRDADGIGVGAIRLPEVDVPTAVNSSVNSQTPGSTGFSAFCPLLGSWEPFALDNLEARYTDYGDYLDRASVVARNAGAAGFVTDEGVASLIADAARLTRLRPTAPTPGAGTPATGVFSVAWRGPDGPSTRTTYELQRLSSAADAEWTTVPGAGAVSAGEFAFPASTPEVEGTHRYRVRGTTLVPTVDKVPEHLETTSFSAELTGVKVDRTAPAAPTVTTDREAEDVAGGWFRDAVTVSFAGNPDPDLPDGSAGSGLNPASVPASTSYSETTTTTASGTTADNAGNVSAPGTRAIRVDATPPVLDVTCPTGVFVGDTATATVAASDAHSGLATDPSGSPAIDTASAGTRTVTATATDRVGHSVTRSCTVAVRAAPAGAQGPQGLPGEQGATGTQGPTGSQGPTGTTGSQGPAGAQGVGGQQGPVGPRGKRGPRGRAAKVTCKVSGKRRVTCVVRRAGRGATRVALARGSRVVARGRVAGSGRLVVRGTRALRGRYTLTVTVDGRRVQRRTVEL